MCLNNTTLFEEAANDDADRHANLMQEQREGWELKEGWDGKVIKTGSDYE